MSYTPALLTDLYELTMMAGYLDNGKAGDTATFDLYFRRNPYCGGYAVAAGLQDAVAAVTEARFSEDDIRYIRSLKSPQGRQTFPDAFLDYLNSYRFRGDIRAVPEGTVVFPNEPLLQVRGGVIECQLVEAVLLCHINFQTLIATKAARIWESAHRTSVLEFGLRRAQGPDGAMSATRAAMIGGADATSNVLGAASLGMPARGTHAHSWIQSFDSELAAFRAYAALFPDECTLLVDTYDTLKSGIPNAIQVGRELQAQGHRLAGIRIDSGDLAFLSKKAREALDEAGLDYVKIVASNELDEYIIADILAQGGKIDIWGVGTRMVTGAGEGGGALGGVYKMAEYNGQPKIKISSNLEKMTNPGFKKIVRCYGRDGLMDADALAEDSEDLSTGDIPIVDPNNPLRRTTLRPEHRVELLVPVVAAGEPVYDFPSLEQIRRHRTRQLDELHESYKRLPNPHEYKVGLTHRLWDMKEKMIAAVA
ncbi:MAG: nicotinate phosphoribosyltransferase, partial [Acidobacteriota bacterium]|nr:nicotinate phosphoribosyltransferase [Acidobacteriota bacterium]